MKYSGLIAGVGGLTFVMCSAAASDPYEATRARPLFAPTRRPPPAPASAPRPVLAPQAIVVPPPPPPLTLSGVILGPDVAVALLTRQGRAEAARVVLGGIIDGWRVSEIRPRAVVLTLEQRSVTVGLPASAR
jgi:hypothetical protein